MLSIINVVNFFYGRIEEKKLEIVISPSPNIPEIIEYDIMHLDTILSDILSNAVKFAPEGTKINISVEKTIIEGEKDTVSGVKVSIADQGAGVPEEDLKDIFKPYKQSAAGKLKEGSTGLGLAICDFLVKGHGGRVWAENNADGGAIFSFELPLVQSRRAKKSDKE
jgi:signal transduction histidine kinase